MEATYLESVLNNSPEQFLPVDSIDDLQKNHFGLLSNNIETKINAAFQLGCLGKQAISELDNLIELARDKNPQLRSRVIASIGRINTCPSKSIPVLIRALFDNDIQVRQSAAAGLGLFYPDDLVKYDAEKYLQRALLFKDACIQEFVSGTLLQIKIYNIKVNN